MMFGNDFGRGMVVSAALCVALLVVCPVVLADVYQGSLVYSNYGAVNTGLFVDGRDDGWQLYTSIEWLVSNEQPGAPTLHPWYYSYTVTVQKYGLSHMTLELSDDFQESDMTGLTVNGVPHTEFSIGIHSPNPGSPLLPEALFGVKFDDLDDGIEVEGYVIHELSFFSNRTPVWGDVYLKGGQNDGFNQGFTVNDWDPTDAPADGSLDGHLLVPNSIGELTDLASLGSYVWFDINGDGIWDTDEPAFPGLIVNLYDAQNVLLDSTVTDDDGLFLFSDLMPGDYELEFILPDGYAFTLQNMGDDPFKDSDVDMWTGLTGLISLSGGQVDLSWGAGLLQADDHPPIPEPAGLSLLGLALLGVRRRRRR